MRRLHTAFVLAMLVAAAQTAGAAASGQVDEAREVATRNGSARVIVRHDAGILPEGMLSRPGEVAAQRQRIARTGQRLLDRVARAHKKSAHRFQYVPLVSLEVTPEGLEELVEAPEAVSVWIDRAVRPTLTQSVPLIGGDVAFDQGFEGTAQAVAVLDTGVDATHPFLAGRVVADACFSSTVPSQSSTSVCPGGASSSTAPGSGGACPANVTGCNHGTHVAGIAAGNGAGFDGVARDAGVIAVQVFSSFSNQALCGPLPAPCALSFVSDQIRGLEHVFGLRTQLSIASVNMSLGGGRFASACDSEPQKPAIDLLRSVGIATVIASGNDGFGDSIGSPACISSAISVGSTTKSDQVSSFSNSAGILDLLAPGSSIVSSVPGGFFASFNGTSMATPHVAGAFAVLREKAPNATVDELLTALSNTGVGIGDGRNGLTRPRVRLDLALDEVSGVPPAAELTVTPDAGLTASGSVGGPFAPSSQVYTLENTGTAALDFAVTSSASWIALSQTSGSLAPGATTAVAVSIAASAATLPPGLLSGSVGFQNTTNGVGNTSRPLSLTIAGPAVANDKFADAFLLSTDSGTTLATNAGATKEPGEPQHGGDTGGSSVWWRWIAPRDGALAVDTFGSDFDTLLGLYTGGAVDALTTIASNDDAPGRAQSEIEATVVEGTSYWIAVDGGGGASGDVTLSWRFTEDLGSRTALAVTPEAGFVSAGPPGGPFAPDSIVYTLTNTDAATLQYTITTTADFVDLSSAGGELAPGASTQLSVSLNPTADGLPPGSNTGVVRIGEVERDVQLEISAGAVTNDAFAARRALVGSTASDAGTNIGATKEPDEPDHADNAGGASVWWTWSAPANGLVTIDTEGSNFDTTLGVYTGTAVDALTEVASNDDSSLGLQSRVTFQAVGGLAYQIAVDGYNAETGSLSLRLEGGLAERPGDAFERRVRVNDLNDPISSSNDGATREPGEPEHAGNPGGASVWFEWTAVASGFVTADTLGSDFDTLLAVYTGTDLDSLTLIGENDDFDAGSLDFSSVVSFDAVAGVTYLIAVDGWGGDSGSLELSFSNSDFPNVIESFEAGQLFGSWSVPAFADAGWSFASFDPTEPLGPSFDGSTSFLSDEILGGQVAALEFTGEFVEGELRFAYQVDSEEGFDFFVFQIDDEIVLIQSGLVPWIRSDDAGFAFPISAGAHTLRWSYAKDGSVDVGIDGAWIDAIEFFRPDADDDGVPDDADNCLEEPNNDQRDANQDGFGDACDPDYNDDGAVGIPDFGVIRAQFGRTDADPGFDPAVDHNGDGAIGIADFNLYRSFFGLAPGPSGLGCAGSVPCPAP